MDADLQLAKDILEKECLTCCLVKGDEIFKSTERGVKPLLELLDTNNVEGFFAADKVVGKAAAFLYVLLGVSAVYSAIVSEKAAQVFEKHGISLFYDKMVPAIINRAGNGFCPMETAVADISDPNAALAAINDKLKQLAKK